MTPARILAAAFAGALVCFPAGALAEQPSEGGYSFNDATRLTGPATIKQDLVVGETLFWRIDLKPGQTLKLTSTTAFGADYQPDLNLVVQSHLLTIYGPNRKAATCLGGGQSSVSQADITGTVELTCDSGLIGDGTSDDEWSQPGTYYFTVATTRPAENVRGLVKPLTLNVEVEGEPRPAATLDFDPGEPVDGAIVPTAPPPKQQRKEGENQTNQKDAEADAPDAAASPGGAARVLVPASAGALGCLVGGGLGFAVRRMRPGPPPGPPTGPSGGPPAGPRTGPPPNQPPWPQQRPPGPAGPTRPTWPS
ncbi:hypothetical protein [Flindersiella endophytica]